MAGAAVFRQVPSVCETDITAKSPEKPAGEFTSKRGPPPGFRTRATAPERWHYSAEPPSTAAAVLVSARSSASIISFSRSQACGVAAVAKQSRYFAPPIGDK